MIYTISTLNDNGSGMKFRTKHEFLRELLMMIDDCASNGGEVFAIDVYSDVSCFSKD